MNTLNKIRSRAAAFAAVAALLACGLVPDLSSAQTVTNFPRPILTYDNRMGGALSALNVTAATVVKASPGAVMRIVVIAAGSSGSLTLNDSASTAGASTANEIFTVAQASLTVGEVITLEFPCQNGITVSAVPSGSPQLAISYT